MRIAKRFLVSTTLLAIAVLGTAAGCNSYYPFVNHNSLVGERWGEAHADNVAKMTANPDAGRVDRGPIALDGTTGTLVGESYRESQKHQAKSGVASIIQIDAGN